MNSSRDSFIASQLFDEKTFYRAFLDDIWNCKKEIIIESPFITTKRMNDFRSVFKKKIEEGIKIFVFTRSPEEHEEKMALESELEIQYFEHLGIQTFLCIGNHHRKLAILDRKIVWEGSLNILSQNKSREFMRRLEGDELATQTFEFLEFRKFV